MHIFYRLAALLVTAVVVTSGCASTVRKSSDAQPLPDPAAVAQAKELYAGEPAAVHATEYPVQSAAEGMTRGDDAWRGGDLDLALYLYVQSLAYDPRNSLALLRIGAIHEQRGNQVLATRSFEMALARDPDNAGICERLGLLYLRNDNLDGARKLLQRAVTLDGKRWQSHDGLGVLADRAKDYEVALSHYNRALDLQPKSAQVLNNRGYSRFLADDLDAAEKDFRAAIELGSAGNVWSNMAMVHARRKHYTLALEDFLRSLDPPHAYNELGKAAVTNGEFLRAQQYFEQAISLSPSYFEDAQKNLVLARQRLQGDAVLTPGQ